MNDCAHTQRLIPLLYDGELDSPLRREVSDHVADCTGCTRALAMLDRSQELLRQVIDERLDNMDFSGFWQGVEDKLSQKQPSGTERFRIWFDSWRALWTWRAPAWTAASLALIMGAALLFSWIQQDPQHAKQPPIFREYALVDDSEQAHIESLSASDTVSVWNEPTSNATVIWVSDEGEGMSP